MSYGCIGFAENRVCLTPVEPIKVYVVLLVSCVVLYNNRALNHWYLLLAVVALRLAIYPQGGLGGNGVVRMGYHFYF